MSFAVETSLPIPPDNRFSSLRDFFHLNSTVGNESAGPKKLCLTWSLHLLQLHIFLEQQVVCLQAIFYLAFL